MQKVFTFGCKQMNRITFFGNRINCTKKPLHGNVTRILHRKFVSLVCYSTTNLAKFDLWELMNFSQHFEGGIPNMSIVNWSTLTGETLRLINPNININNRNTQTSQTWQLPCSEFSMLIYFSVSPQSIPQPPESVKYIHRYSTEAKMKLYNPSIFFRHCNILVVQLQLIQI